MVRDNGGKVFKKRTNCPGIQRSPMSPRLPWRNPFVERLMDRVRRESLAVSKRGSFPSRRADVFGGCGRRPTSVVGFAPSRLTWDTPSDSNTDLKKLRSLHALGGGPIYEASFVKPKLVQKTSNGVRAHLPRRRLRSSFPRGDVC